MSDSLRAIPTFVERERVSLLRRRRRAARPTAREWVRHGGLFLLTLLTATCAGTLFAVPQSRISEPALPAATTPLDYVLLVPSYLLQLLGGVSAYAFAHPEYIAQGATFACALLFILLAHEAGHYVACRLYGVDATAVLIPCRRPSWGTSAPSSRSVADSTRRASSTSRGCLSRDWALSRWPSRRSHRHRS